MSYLYLKTLTQQIMKRHFLIAAFSAALLSTGCSDEGQPISIDIGPEIIPAEGGKTVLTFTPPMHGQQIFLRQNPKTAPHGLR